MIKGNITLEDISIEFTTDHEKREVTYTVTDTFESELFENKGWNHMSKSDAVDIVLEVISSLEALLAPPVQPTKIRPSDSVVVKAIAHAVNSVTNKGEIRGTINSFVIDNRDLLETVLCPVEPPSQPDNAILDQITELTIAKLCLNREDPYGATVQFIVDNKEEIRRILR